MVPADYQRIEKVILFLEGHFKDQPKLKEVAKQIGLSEFHFQRIFRRWAGISPKRFLQYLTATCAENLLRKSWTILDTTHEVGLSSASRLHDLLINIHAVTPGEFKNLGKELTIRFGIHPTPFGECLISVTERGICGLAFAPPESRKGALEDLKAQWKNARLLEDPAVTRPMISRIFKVTKNPDRRPLDLFIQGTNFQIKVWEALLKIPFGAVASYKEIAGQVGAPGGARAVGSAVSQNPVAFLIPCHRVIRNSGLVGEYHWGTARKKAILVWEACKYDNLDPF